MIDFRYHIVSLISVFLALALGIVVGTTQLNGAVLSDLRHQVKGLKSDKHNLQQDTRTLQGQIKGGDAFAKSVAPAVVANKLSGASVLVVAAPGASGATVDGVTSELKDAGATITAQAKLTADYIDPRRASDMKGYVTSALPAGFKLPTTDDAGVLAGALLADVLTGKADQKEPTDDERQQVLAGFGTLNVVRLQETNVKPADYAVLVSSDAMTGDNPQAQAKTLAALGSALQQRTKGVLIAGNSASAESDGLLGVVRADDTLSAKLSTVDNADSVSGQVVSVLGLAALGNGKPAGQYGLAGNAGSQLPAITP
ncbi:MAG TPA: copper transporter [Mycobacteriales bacterium]|nr:copper transporter [Mycobacteriales bacterium]